MAKQKWISTDDYPKELVDWINWAESYADNLNPLRNGFPKYQKATEILKLEYIE